MRSVALVAALLALSATALAVSSPAPVETRVVATGAQPCGTAVGHGSLWVAVYGTGKLLRLDPATGRVTSRISVGRWACRVAIEESAAWVTRDQAGILVRLDLRTRRRRQFRVGATPFDALATAGSVWVTSFGVATVARIDMQTRKLTRVYKNGPNPAGITSCGGHIWVGYGREATWLVSIDAATHRMRRIDVGTKSPSWPRCVRGELWVTAPRTVLRLDARSGALLGRLRLGGTPAEAAAGPDGLVWVTDKERSLVHRIDPVRFELVDSFDAGPGAFSLVRASGGMWVTSFAGADVRRFEP